ncbi:hypothetical protein [Methanosarcina sp. 1.H.T.1A.1]|uniref:hypothetical protein n=1 Tax=Methanosarcina sp. 1.H.T.1A.1 TaxID=1483602 RepID=UPI000AFA7D04|nr:hypothetical protein [Methanosarcina sp. 1.H.T.1A.1]
MDQSFCSANAFVFTYYMQADSGGLRQTQAGSGRLRQVQADSGGFRQTQAG